MEMNEIENIELTFLTKDDYEELKEAMIEAYSSMPDSYWKERHIQSLIAAKEGLLSTI